MLLWIASKWRNCHGLQGKRVDKTNQIYNKEWEVFVKSGCVLRAGIGTHDNVETILLSEDWRMYRTS